MTKPGFEPLLIGHSQKNDSYMLKSASLLPVQLVFQTKSNQLIYKRLSDGLNFSSKHIRQHTSTPPQKYDLNKIKGKQKRKTERLRSADTIKTIHSCFPSSWLQQKTTAPMHLVHELEIQDHQDGQDKGGYDETDDPLVSVHSPHHASNDPPALANVDINVIQLQ